ncbi:Uncharacterised protein [Chlamydia trachomatis]|nr:Uncharacterised protein [Chlamydia trachomatis]
MTVSWCWRWASWRSVSASASLRGTRDELQRFGPRYVCGLLHAVLLCGLAYRVVVSSRSQAARSFLTG